MDNKTKTFLAIGAAVGTAAVATYLIAKGGLKDEPSTPIDLNDSDTGWNDDGGCENCGARDTCGFTDYEATTSIDDEKTEDEEITKTEDSSADTRPLPERMEDYLKTPATEEKVFNPDPIGKMTQSGPTTKKGWFDK